MSTSGTPRSGGQRPAGGSSAQGAAPRGQQRTPSQGARQGNQRTQGTPGSRPTGTGTSRPQRPAQRPAQQGLVRPAPKAKVRKARLLVSKVDPWSVLKMAFLLSVALGIVTVVGAVVLWTVMDLTGIFDQVNDLLAQVLGSEGGSFTVQQLISLGQVASFATIIAVVNVVLLTALSMLAAVLYNISSTLVGGIGVTLTDD
ncbi:hypothetical protein F7P69_21450 [Cellulosimicrobium funkei]|nr:hypothetical protein [Cellulosimicrobium funkei]